MGKKVGLGASWEGLEMGDGEVYSEMYYNLSDPDKSGSGSIGYPPELFPERGRYATDFDITLWITEEPRDVGQSIGLDVSTCEFLATYRDKQRGGSLLLYDPSSEESVADIKIQSGSDLIPGWLEDGDECFVTVEIEYPYEEKLKQHSEEKLRRDREKYQELIEEFK